MDHSLQSAEVVEKDLKVNFYEKLFPVMSKFEIKIEDFNRETTTAQAEPERHIFIDYKCETSDWYSFIAISAFFTALLISLILNPIVKRLRDSGYTRLTN